MNWRIGWSWPFSWTGYRKPMKILVKRTSKTDDGIFGTLTLDWNPFTCVTLERLDKAIDPGTYPLVFSYSPHFNKIMPEIQVPGRSAIRIHPANYPYQLEGCIAVGSKEDGDSIDDSRVAFNQLFGLISMQAGLQIEVAEAYV